MTETASDPGFLSLHQITLAVEDGEAMAAFYNAVFDTGLRPFRAGKARFWRGNLAGVNLLFCPNEIASVDARQARHQFLIAVPDLVAAGRLARDCGGAVEGPLRSAGRECLVVRDPEGNPIELIEAS
ncbi:MAG: VOC family protein [bacterium]